MPVRFSQVDADVYRGGHPSTKDLHTLSNTLGIKKVISLDGDIGNEIAPVVEELGMEHIIYPLTDGNGDGVAGLPDEVVQWTEGGPTYVHCKHGKDRTGMAVAMYRVLINGWSKRKALTEAHSFGMGLNLDFGGDAVRNSYYEAVANIDEDTNSSMDAVTQVRDDIANHQHPPGMNNQQEPRAPNGFAPMTDPTTDHFNRPAGVTLSMIKLAQFAANSGDAITAGRSIASIIQFLLQRIDPGKAPGIINNIKGKISTIDATDLSSKQVPTTAAIGQSINLIKNILMGYDPHYIGYVLHHIKEAL